MKLTILGVSGGFPAAGGATSGYLLEIGNHHILIDCGSGVLSKLFSCIPLEQLSAVILTHLHHDHISDMQVLKYAIDISRNHGIDLAPIPVIAPRTPEQLAASLESDGNLIIGHILPDSPIKLFDATIRFFPMEHPLETYGLLIEAEGKRLAYTADSVPCANLSPLLDQADLAIMDAGSLERLRRPVMMHMTAQECGRIARESGVKRLLLSHLVPVIDPRETLAEAQAEFPQAELATVLQTIEL